LNLKVLIFPIYLPVPSMELVTMEFKEEEILISGLYGQEVQNSNLTFKMSVNLTVNSEHKLFLFGKLLYKQWIPILHINQVHFCFMRDITAVLVHYETIWIVIWNLLLTSSWKLIKVDFYKHMLFKLPLKLKEWPNLIVLELCIGNLTMLGQESVGQV